ncbi:NUDIX domain-containing protein [Ciceribacter sp. RN22]|uniref:NUDIX domain-containing protein n=1 Tax=Ciceribacter sp. RN22 TaxID=2954932 RepID=UPI002092E210|nr:NUDIX domain-containing protein [Ciceribacter sp. RN22]MCO6177788.1 NUDIX domain-containing protein [Ciceribacter sp. RN22]
MSKFDRTGITVRKDETLWKGWSHLRRVTFDYRRDDGRETELVWEVFDRGRAVAILLFDPTRETVVLVRQFRIPVHLMGDPAFLLEVPAGGVEEDAPESAVCREVLEETGYRIDKPRFLFAAYTSPGSLTEKVYFYVATVTSVDKVADGGGLDHEHEDLELSEIPLDEALEMIGTGAICDAKTIMLLQWAALNRESLLRAVALQAEQG